MDTAADTEIEFGTFPKLESVFSIKRSTGYKLINGGEIKSRYVRPKGSRTGVRLIDFNSVREYLSRAEEKPLEQIVAQKKDAALASAKNRAEAKAKREAKEAKARAAENGNTG